MSSYLQMQVKSVHTIYVAEVSMECTIIICQLIGSVSWKENKGQTVDELAGQLWQYEGIPPYGPGSQLWKNCQTC